MVNFQSWLDPFIIITALPGALAGITWALLLTHTTLNVPSLTGAIMCMGVATANSILMVSFARERMDEGMPARDAAVAAGHTRMRPVLMTALAMIIGMAPMAMGLGEGGEQNAPLGRAVIGGLLFATVATLFFVPTVFGLIHGAERTRILLEPGVIMSTEQMPILEPETGNRGEPSPKTWRWMVAALLAVVGLAAAGVLSIKARAKEQVALSAETPRLAVTTISAGYPQPEPRSNELELPGSVQAYTESPIYARTNGYLLRWYKDIGASVQKGDLLADLDTPEIDQELSQAQAARQQMVAASIWRARARRWRELRRTDSVSQQELDQKTSDYAQAQANLAAADANVRRLQQLESFKHVYAPFAGVLTRRNVDIGALVNAGNGGSGKELFNLALIDPLRVYVSVPEADAPAMRAGMRAWIALAEFPASRFTGTVVRTANAIDQNTRTLLTEVDVPNKAGPPLAGGLRAGAL